jgi:hypothetical protein
MEKVKLLNKVLIELEKKLTGQNIDVIKKLKIPQASFYAARKKLVMLKRVDPHSFVVINKDPVSAGEYASVPYPYGKRVRKLGKAWKKEVGKHYKRLSDIRREKGILDEPLVLPVKEKADTITLSYDELVKIVIAAKGVK